MAFKLLIPLLFALPAFGQIKETIKDNVPMVVLRAQVPENIDVAYTFKKLTMNRTGDGKANVLQLLDKSPAFRNDAPVGEFIGLSIGDKIYNNVAVEQPVLTSKKEAAPSEISTAKKRVDLQITMNEIDNATLSAVEQVTDSSAVIRKSKTWDLLFYLLAFSAIFFRAVAMAAASEYANGISRYFGVIAEKCRVICFTIYWVWALYISGLMFWIGFYYHDFEQVIALIFSIYSLAIITLLALMEIMSRGSMWFAPNIRPQKPHNPQQNNKAAFFKNNNYPQIEQ